MSRRLSLLPTVFLLGACLAVLPACKKKPVEEGGGGGGGGGTEPSPPSAASSDYLLFAQVNAKGIRESALLNEVKQAFVKAGAGAEWDHFDSEPADKLGVKLTEIESATFCVTDFQPKGGPRVIAILAANKAFNKSAMLKGKDATRPDPRGFHKAGPDLLLHFPDDKTLVILHPDLAQQYLDGYAKNRSSWPLTADLTRAASGHTVFVAVNTQKLPREAFDAPEAREFAALASARAVTLTADLKGKELSLGVRATYPDAAAAAKAKDQALGLIKQGTAFVDEFAGSKELAEFGMLKPAVTEAKRAITAAKLDVSGSDLTLAASYKADFDIGQMIADAIPKIREAGARTNAASNMKQIGLALHIYHDAMGTLPILGVGANGAPLRNATDKPLLSWRVAILPYIEQNNLYQQFKLNEPWDSENNKKLLAQMPKIFAPVGKPGKAGFTHLQMVVGPGATPIGARFPASFPDGTSNTIAVIEAANPVEWTKPEDVTLPAKLAPGALKKLFGGQFPGGFNVVLWDGSVRFVKDTVSERTLALLLNPNDGQVIPNDW
jgi:hypothetical protein